MNSVPQTGIKIGFQVEDEIEKENGKQRRIKPMKLEYCVAHRLKMDNEKRNLCESVNKRVVALKNCGECRVEIERIDLPGGNAEVDIQSIESKRNQIISVQANADRMQLETLKRLRWRTFAHALLSMPISQKFDRSV